MTDIYAAIFDMDGVLVDVTGSYRETIVRVAQALVPAAPALLLAQT